MRRALALALLCTGAVTTARGQSIVAGPVATQIFAGVGERITIPVAVNMTGAPGIALGSYRARLKWNPTLMRLVSATAGTFSAPAVNADSAAQGVLRFAAATSQGTVGVPILVNVTLEVQSLASADTFRLTFPEMNAATTFQDLLPFLSVTTGSFCAGAIFGDLNQDGVIQAVDAQIALMHAVGMTLPPGADTLAGDVDADGTVGTRDALIILSDVIQLDVSQFRIGTLQSGICQTGNPTQVLVVPSTVTLAAGDSFRVSAQVRDSAGNLAPGLQLAWSSSTPGTATVDSLGVVRALADGSVTITAAVSPALMGNGAVTIGPRRRWRVDPANARGPGTEVGSDTYPFSTIGQAVQRAAPGDTIAVAAAPFTEPLATTKPLVFLGDSGASGMPRLRTPGRAAADVLTAGRVVIRRFRVEQSGAGFNLEADTIDLSSVAMTSLQGPGMRLAGTGRATVRGVTIDGAAKIGIGIDRQGPVQLAQVTIRGVSGGEQDTTGGILAVGPDSLFLDTVRVSGARNGIIVRRVELVRMRGGSIISVGDGLSADSTVTIRVDNGTVIREVGRYGVWGDADSVRLTNVTIRRVGEAAVSLARPGYHDATLTGVAIDSTPAAIVGPPIGINGRRFTVLNSVLRAGGGNTVWPRADTVYVDSTTIGNRNGYLCGLVLGSGTRYTRVRASRFEHAGFGIGVCTPDPYTTGDFSYPSGGYVEVRGSVFDTPYTAIHVHPDSLLFQDDTVRATGWGVFQEVHGGVLTPQWVRVRGGRAVGTLYEGIYVSGAVDVTVAGVTVDSAYQACGGTCAYDAGAVWLGNVATARVDSSRIRYARASALVGQATGSIGVYRDTVAGNDPGVLGGDPYPWQSAFLLQAPVTTVRQTAVLDSAGRGGAVELRFTGVDDTVVVDSNFVYGADRGVAASGFDTLTNRVRVAHNTFASVANVAQFEFFRALLVDSNTVTGQGQGFATGPHDTVRARGNTFTGLGGGDNAFVTTRARASDVRLEGNDITCTSSNSAMAFNWQGGGDATFSGNTITGCLFGAFFPQPSTDSSRMVVRGNVIQKGGGTTAPAVGIQLQSGYWDVEMVGNTLADGVFTFGGLVVTTKMMGRVDSNVASGSIGRIIRAAQIDSATFRGNTINSGPASGAISQAGGILVGTVAGWAVVAGNTVSGFGEPGIRILAGTPAGRIRVDSNLVVDGQTAGVLLLSPVSGVRNGIRRNVTGILDSVGGSSFALQDIEGNGYGYLNTSIVFSTDTLTWWGAADGPICNFDCSTGSGNEVSEYLSYFPIATAPVNGVPAGAPPVMASGALTPRVGTLRLPVVAGDLLPVADLQVEMPTRRAAVTTERPRPVRAGSGGGTP